MSSVDWGNVPAWVGAIGTTGAFIVAFALAFRQRSNDRLEAALAQAELMTAWLDIGRDDSGQKRVRLLARNSSPSQINDFRGIVHDFSNSETPDVETWFPGLPPTGSPVVENLKVELPSDEQRYRYELTYEFTDVRNRRWRHSRGEGLQLLKKDAGSFVFGPDGTPAA